MKKTILFFVCIIVGITSYSQSNTWSVKFSNAIISRYTPTVDAMTAKSWEYSNSIMLHGIEKVNYWVNDTNYLNYIKKYVDAYVSANGTINPVVLSTTMDKIHPGLLCLYLYQQTGLTKYKTAATNLKNYLFDTTKFKKTPDGGYWHKNDGTYNNVMMLDGIYMAQPFLAKYGSMFNDTVCLNTATFQTLFLASHVYDSSLHLVKHAWDYNKSRVWANTKTGASSEVWSRGMGWYAMAVVDILRYLPKTHKDYNKLKAVLNNIAIGIKSSQDSTSGLWYQVVNKKDSAANYIETSGSGMYIYALKIAADSNWVDTAYLAVARKGWTGLQKKISTYTDGKPAINSFAPAMSVQNNYTAYVGYLPVNCPAAIGVQHPHGYCGLLMAASVMEFPITALPLQFINLKSAVSNGATSIYWSVESAENSTEYCIEKSIDGNSFINVGSIKANDQNQYSWIDKNETQVAYYRIKAIEKNGKSVYSQVLFVEAGETKNELIIFPNPASNNKVNFQLNNFPVGNYNIRLVDVKGSTIVSQNTFIAKEGLMESFAFSNINKGIYILQLNGARVSASKKLVVQGVK